MTSIRVGILALMLWAAPASAQTQWVHYDPVGAVDETNLPASAVAPGLSATSLRVVGAMPGGFADSFHTLGWSDGPTIAPGEYLEFGVTGVFVAGSIQHSWFASSFGPNLVTVRSNLDGFTTDLATAAKSTTVTLDISSLGAISGSITFRLYFHGGSPGPDPTTNVVFIDGSVFGQIGLRLLGPMPGAYPSSCNGDGGNQMGCTSCPCGNDALPGSIGGCLNSAASSATLIASGLASVSADSLRMEMPGGPLSSFAVLPSGSPTAPTTPANPCFGLDSGIAAMTLDGLRCAVQSVQRHGARPTDSNGDVGVTTAGWGPPNGPPGGLIAQGGFAVGQTRHYQVIYREAPTLGCMTGQNTSQAVSVTFEP